MRQDKLVIAFRLRIDHNVSHPIARHANGIGNGFPSHNAADQLRTEQIARSFQIRLYARVRAYGNTFFAHQHNVDILRIVRHWRTGDRYPFQRVGQQPLRGGNGALRRTARFAAQHFQFIHVGRNALGQREQMLTVGFRNIRLHVHPAIDIPNYRVDQHQQIGMLHFDCLQPLRQQRDLAGAAHIAGGDRFKLAQDLALFQRLKVAAEPLVRDHPAVEGVVVRRIAEQHRWHGGNVQPVGANIRHRDAVSHAAVHHLRLNGDNIGLLRPGVIPE